MPHSPRRRSTPKGPSPRRFRSPGPSAEAGTTPVTADVLQESHRCALSVARRAAEISFTISHWGETHGNKSGLDHLSVQLVHLARDVVENEAQEMEAVSAASDVFSAVRVSAIQGWRKEWHPNAHLALAKLAESYSLDLAYTFSTDEVDYDGSVAAERVGWGESLTKGDVGHLAKLVEGQRQRLTAMLLHTNPQPDVDRLTAEAQVELAKARILL